MSDWADFAVQTAGPLLGVLIGGAIAVMVARWQTTKTLTTQAWLASTQQLADARLARAERDHERAVNASRQLLERLADLYAWLPSLPDVSEDVPRLSTHARDHCITAMESLRRGMHTEIFSISDPALRERYRTLVQLAYDIGWRGVGRGNHERQINDAKNYLRYVQYSLEAVIEGKPLPDPLPPPVLDRADPAPWQPPYLPPHWGDSADGS